MKFNNYPSPNNIRLALCWSLRFRAKFNYTEFVSCRLQSAYEKENGVSIKRGLKEIFCYSDSKEAVEQSVSALCLVKLLKTMVVGSSPGGWLIFVLSMCILFLELHLWKK